MLILPGICKCKCIVTFHGKISTKKIITPPWKISPQMGEHNVKLKPKMEGRKCDACHKKHIYVHIMQTRILVW